MTDSFRKLIEKVSAEAEVYQIKLPVKDTELSPVFSKESVDFHYGVLYKHYVEKSLAGEGKFQTAGAKLHTLLFEQLQKPKITNNPSGLAKILIDNKFGNYNKLKSEITKKALEIHGSGWVYLSNNGTIKVIANHEWFDDILIIFDLWEHSFLRDYGADKEKYLRNIWQVLNWDIINTRLNLQNN